MKVSVLCAQKNSIYSQLSGTYENSQSCRRVVFKNSQSCSQFTGVLKNSQFIEIDIFDKKRNALLFRGGSPVIAHPPCRLWSKLSHFSTVKEVDRDSEMNLGRFCVQKVIECGGVLEHPFGSRLFKDMGLPLGGFGNELGFTLEIPQRIFGHSMIKNTWLFFSKIRYESLDSILPVLHSKPLRRMENLSTKQREATPYLLALWLVKQAVKAKEQGKGSVIFNGCAEGEFDFENSQSCSQFTGVSENSQLCSQFAGVGL